MRPPARRRLVVVLLVVVVAAGGLAGVAIWQGSPGSLAARKGHLAAVELTPAGEDAISTMSQVTLHRSTGRDVTALVRVPRGAGQRTGSDGDHEQGDDEPAARPGTHPRRAEV